MTIVITAVADGGGRKMLLISGAVLMAIAGWVFMGALAVGLPSLFSLPPVTGYRFLMGSYVICAVVMMILFGFLSSTIEAKTKTISQTPMIDVQRSRSVVAKLAGLFALGIEIGFIAEIEPIGDDLANALALSGTQRHVATIVGPSGGPAARSQWTHALLRG